MSESRKHPVSARLPEPLHQDVKSFCASEGLSMSAGIEVLLERGLFGASTPRVPAKMNDHAPASKPIGIGVGGAPNVELSRLEGRVADLARAIHATSRALIGNQLESASDETRSAARAFLDDAFAGLVEFDGGEAH